MRNCIIYLLLSITSLSCFAQIQSGEVIYSVSKNKSSELKENNTQGYFEFKTKVDNIVPYLEFNLKFNSINSVFKLKENLPLENDEMLIRAAKMITRADKIFFTDKTENLIYEQMNFLGDEIIIISSINELDWKLTKESKKIDNYLCFKAITSIEIETNLNKKKKVNYTAWYCPSISYNYGPINIVGLPGLVLEFSNGSIVYYAKQIQLSENKIIINKPTKGKLITKEAFNDLGKNTLNKN